MIMRTNRTPMTWQSKAPYYCDLHARGWVYLNPERRILDP